MKKQINTCLFMSMKCILIKIKFDIELLKTIWKHKEKVKYLILTGSAAAQSSNLSMYLMDLSFVPMPTRENVWSTSTHFRQALKLLKGLTVGKFGHRPKVSLLHYKR